MSMGSRTGEASSPPRAAARTGAEADTSDCGNTAGTVAERRAGCQPAFARGSRELRRGKPASPGIARARTCKTAGLIRIASAQVIDPWVSQGSCAVGGTLRMLNARLTAAAAHRTLRPVPSGGKARTKTEEKPMRNLARAIAAAAWVLVLVPSTTWAQASIAGVVRDQSGSVLPGVTVEVSSPALIEKTRTALSDSSGQYRVIDLRPGTYSVVFTLPGFNQFRRDGIELTGALTATINADLRVGDLQEPFPLPAERR